MKIKLLTVICLIFSVTTVLFLGLWQSEKHDRTDIRNIAANAASSSLESFKEFRDTGDTRYYNSAVSEFYAFETAYSQIVYNTNDSANYVFCNEVYGSLIAAPEKSMTHIDEIIEVMEIIAADIDDPGGFLRMSSLRNSIKE